MGAKVLIVDDEPDAAIYLSVALRENGFNPVVAGSAESGFDLLGEIKPDLVCLDIMMPRSSGISLYTRMREDGKFADIPVVIVSGVVQDGRFDFRSYVPDENVTPPEYVLEKPVDVPKLIKIVASLTGDKTSAGRKPE